MPDLVSLLVHGVGAVIASLVGLEVARRLGRLRETEAPEHGRELSLECGARLPVGQHPLLGRRTRLARAVVRQGAVELSVFRWGLRVWRHPAFTLDVACVDRASVRRAGWWTDLNASTTVRRVSVTTREGVLVDLSLPVEDVEVQLAEQQVPVSGLERLRVQTTDAHAVGANVSALAQRLRTAGATPAITVLAVERLAVPGQLVELDAMAHTT